MKTEFFLAMIPPTVTSQEKKVTVKNGKPVIYKTAEIKAAEQKFLGYLGKHVPEQPYVGATRLIVRWFFSRGKHNDGEYKTTKPDTDNLQKIFKDCMTQCGYWKDDALVCSELIEKFWADIPGIYVRIEDIYSDFS